MGQQCSLTNTQHVTTAGSDIHQQHLYTYGCIQMSIQMSANVDVECRQGSLQMLMEIHNTQR